MAETAEKLAIGGKAQQAYLSGRIEDVREFDGRWLHLVRLPSPDQYEHPATVEVTADSKLGRKGDELETWVKISGVPNNFKTRDGDTVHSARNFLVAMR